MPTRKVFLTAAASLPLLAAAPATPQTVKTPSPKPSPSPKPPSELARSFAERMRVFDRNLSEKNLHDIAAGIDGNLEIGNAVNPKGRTLKNWDEPVTIFVVPQ